jgi:acetyl esterase
MPLDAQIAQFLQEYGEALAFPRGARHVPSRTDRYLADIRPRLNTPAAEPSEPVFEVHDDATDGGTAVRIYRPSPAEDHPVIVYLHGGGWVSGGLEMNDGWCRRLAVATRAAVVSVDYRLAPEHPYPAGLDDTMDALAWTRENARGFGADPARLAVSGTSAGGNFAAAACLVCRDRGLPMPRVQILLYPVLDVPRDNSSYLDNASGYLLEREQMEWYWDCYLPGRAREIPDYAAPGHAEQVDGLPPAVVASAEYDPLRDDADDYAARLRAAGIPVEHLRCTGMIHGFLSFLDVMPVARAHAERITSAVAAMLRTHAAA